MQRPLGRAGVLRRHQLGPGEIGEQQLVRDREAAALGAAGEMVARSRPRTPSSAPSLRSDPRRSTALLRLVRLDELEGSGMGVQAVGSRRRRLAARAGSGTLADRARPPRAVQGDQRSERVVAERRREGDLLPRGVARRPRGSARRSARGCGRREPRRRRPAPPSLASATSTRVEKPSVRTPAKAGPEGGARLAVEGADVLVAEQEGARHRPLAGLGRRARTRRCPTGRGGWCGAAS